MEDRIILGFSEEEQYLARKTIKEMGYFDNKKDKNLLPLLEDPTVKKLGLTNLDDLRKKVYELGIRVYLQFLFDYQEGMYGDEWRKKMPHDFVKFHNAAKDLGLIV